MYLLTVSLLAKGIPYEELSYFSKQQVNTGDLVEVTVRKRVCRALVLNVVRAAEEKQSLKQASFVAKKISKVITPSFLDESIWKSLAYMSSYMIRPVGEIIHDLLSEKSFEQLSRLSVPEEKRGFEILLLEQDYSNRLSRYKSTIREMFSKKKSLVIFFPSVTDIDHAKEHLSKGIEDYVSVLHGSLTDKQYTESLQLLLSREHPVLILTTPSLLPWSRKDLGLVIIEREHSHYYYTHGDTGYDMRLLLESLARHSEVPCLLGSHMLSLRAQKMLLTKDASEIMPLLFRNDTNLQIITMKDQNLTANPFLSTVVLELLHTLKTSQQGHYFFYAHRKGMYPTTVCSDCGELFTCAKCHRPYVLHKIAGIRTYVCHGCEDIVHLSTDSTLSCRYCGGWRMTTLGIATTGIEEELSRLGIPIFVIDSERTPTKTKVKKVYKEWQESRYGVLIGTEMAHNALLVCDAAVILSIDSLFSLPEYRTDEKILSLVTELAEKVRHKHDGSSTLLLQTRLKNMPVFKYLQSPSFREVYRHLLKEREQYLLPPYYTVIKASFENLDDLFRKRMEQELEPYSVFWFELGKGVTLLFVHIKESEWAHNEDVREKVKRVVYGSRPVVNPLHFFIS
jgi:primosomal protein N' (replication factor Y) (superfamily II helicase)